MNLPSISVSKPSKGNSNNFIGLSTDYSQTQTNSTVLLAMLWLNLKPHFTLANEDILEEMKPVEVSAKHSTEIITLTLQSCLCGLCIILSKYSHMY